MITVRAEAKCDNCGKTLAWLNTSDDKRQMNMSIAHLSGVLRQWNGWSVGRQVLCNQCRPGKKAVAK